jgi:hypothetical protein
MLQLHKKWAITDFILKKPQLDLKLRPGLLSVELIAQRTPIRIAGVGKRFKTFRRHFDRLCSSH